MKTVTIILSLFLAGCVVATYESPNGEKFSYSRFGDQKLSGVQLTADPNSKTLSIETQKSDAAILSEAIRLLERGIEIGAKGAR